MMKKRFPRKFGDAALATMFFIADRGALLFDEILSGRTKSLTKSLKRIEAAKSIGDWYSVVSNFKENNLRTLVWRLKKKGLLQKDGEGYVLTDLGRKYIAGIRKDRKWDGKWRMVLFDVPENRRRQRSWLTNSLRQQDFRTLQKSVFVGKYPLDEDFFVELTSRNLCDCVRILTIGEIDDEKYLV